MCRNGRNRIFELRRPAAALAAVCLALAMAGTVTAWVSAGEGVVVIQLYVTENSQPCEQAIHCLEAFVESRKGIALQVADVTQDVDALKRIWQLSKEAGLDAPRAPAMYLLNRLRVGFKDEATMQHIVDELLTMDVYVRSGCSRCRKAKLMLADLQQRWPAIQIRYHDIVYDPGARERFEAAARRYGVMAAATPTFEFAGRLIVGYQNDQLTGAKLEAILRSGSPPQQSARLVSAQRRLASRETPAWPSSCGHSLYNGRSGRDRFSRAGTIPKHGGELGNPNTRWSERRGDVRTSRIRTSRVGNDPRRGASGANERDQ